MNARMEVNLRSRRWEVFGSKKKNGWCPPPSCAHYFQGHATQARMEVMTVTYMRTVPTFLALTTGRAFMATKAVGAFVKVKLGDKCHDKI